MSGKYDSKVTPVGPLDAEEMPEAVVPYVFRIAFPASFFITKLHVVYYKSVHDVFPLL